ncbi:MAG TPA: hypothetical protein VK819_10775 [Acidobacteriaceae bacterium]|jgi:hypothetical protein|nr:hypothetical protein [Acidobacteriaceae bacterium]
MNHSSHPRRLFHWTALLDWPASLLRTTPLFRTVSIAALALAFSLALLLLPVAHAQKQVTFPSVTSYNLDKQRVTLPSGMEGQIDLLIISFASEQQQEVESWLPVAQALQHTNFQFRYYQLPVSVRVNFVFRWWETSSMRSDQTDPVTWHWIVPLFIDRPKFLQDLDISNVKQTVVLLVDRQGHVLWRASGSFSEDKRPGLMEAANAH